MASLHPYYRKRLPAPKDERDFVVDGHDFANDGLVDFRIAHLPEEAPDRVAHARSSFDDRAAAAIRAAIAIDGTGGNGPPRIWPRVELTRVVVFFGPVVIRHDRVPAEAPWYGDNNKYFEARDLLEMKWYGRKAPTIHIPRSKCLALLAYADYFPSNRRLGLGLRSMVSRAILAASPGWCGTFGPGVEGTFSLKGEEGNYDMSEMHLLPMVYRHYDDLSPAARELLITQLLAKGRIHRPRLDDTFTRDGNPNDWSRAGFVSPGSLHMTIGETENHILMILTARYLTNQLLYQRDKAIEHDNRRNDDPDNLSCFSRLLNLLRNTLRGDFSEYNAKSYQSETRWALLNLYTYAYDHEVRLAAKMVLDYISAHIAVSTNDLRRLVPFRRRFNDENAAHDSKGFMTVGLLADLGGDPMAGYFAVQAGNIRIYEVGTGSSPAPFGIRDTDVVLEALSDYRLPPLIHDLFVNDRSRRFFQRLHRRDLRNHIDEVNGSRNCDNMEIYASSPSYLITAGGAPATWAVDPGLYAVINGDAVSQQLGVAVTTTFMPTGRRFTIKEAGDLIQFGSFSRKRIFWARVEGPVVGGVDLNFVVLDNVENYGVAPDFACGHQVHLPWWVSKDNTEGVRDGMPQDPRTSPGFSFVRVGRSRLEKVGTPFTPGCFLAIYQETPGGFALMEAFDTWLDPHTRFEDFKLGVLVRNRGVHLSNNVKTTYTTHNGNQVDFRVWCSDDGHSSGAKVLDVRYADADSVECIGQAEKAETIPPKLLNGSIMTSPEEAKVVITNPALKASITLDFTDPAHPRRFDSQTGEFEVAGFHNEVWLDFEYHDGPTEGDVCQPFNTLGGATAAVADRGVIRIVPGATQERDSIGGNKSFALVAPIGGVTIGTPNARPVLSVDVLEGVSDRDVWVQFDWPEINQGDVPYLFTSLAKAIETVADGGVVNIQPGSTTERLTIGSDKRFTLVAPIGGVTLGKQDLSAEASINKPI